jgi:hypothetical protein
MENKVIQVVHPNTVLQKGGTIVMRWHLNTRVVKYLNVERKIVASRKTLFIIEGSDGERSEIFFDDVRLAEDNKSFRLVRGGHHIATYDIL